MPRLVISLTSYFASTHHSSMTRGSSDVLYGPLPVEVYRYGTDSCRSCSTVGCQSRNAAMTFCVSFSACPIPSRLLSCATYLPQYINGSVCPVFFRKYQVSTSL